MAIAFHSVGGDNSDTTTSAYSWTHDITGITNPIIIAVVKSRGGDFTTGVTWNTTENFTKLSSAIQMVGNNDYFTVWYIIPSAIGNHTITATQSSSVSSAGASSAYSGADSSQTNINTDIVRTAQTTTQDLTVSVTPTVANSWIVLAGLVTSQNGLAIAADDGGTTSTKRVGWEVSQGMIADSNSGKSSAYGIHILTSGGSTPWTIGAFGIAIAPVASTVATKYAPAQNLLTLGVS